MSSSYEFNREKDIKQMLEKSIGDNNRDTKKLLAGVLVNNDNDVKSLAEYLTVAVTRVSKNIDDPKAQHFMTKKNKYHKLLSSHLYEIVDKNREFILVTDEVSTSFDKEKHQFKINYDQITKEIIRKLDFFYRKSYLLKKNPGTPELKLKDDEIKTELQIAFGNFISKGSDYLKYLEENPGIKELSFETYET